MIIMIMLEIPISVEEMRSFVLYCKESVLQGVCLINVSSRFNQGLLTVTSTSFLLPFD